MKDIFAGIQADFIKVLTAIAVTLAGFAVDLIGFEPFQPYFAIEVGSGGVSLLVHGSKVKKFKCDAKIEPQIFDKKQLLNDMRNSKAARLRAALPKDQG